MELIDGARGCLEFLGECAAAAAFEVGVNDSAQPFRKLPDTGHHGLKMFEAGAVRCGFEIRLNKFGALAPEGFEGVAPAVGLFKITPQFVPGDPAQPRSEVFTALEGGQAAVGGDKGFLSDIVDGIHLEELACEKGAQPRAVSADNLEKSIGVSPQDRVQSGFQASAFRHTPPIAGQTGFLTQKVVLPKKGSVIVEHFACIRTCGGYFGAMRFTPTLLLLLSLSSGLSLGVEYDVVVFGATPAGIAAAVASGRHGDRVLLVEPTARIGGMVTNGLSHADFRTFEALTGTFLEFSKRVEAHYRKTFGAGSPQVQDSSRGTNGEPKVNLAVYEAMLAELPSVTVKRNWALEQVKCSSEGASEGVGRGMRTVELALFGDEQGGHQSVAARVFIDASYEGDLLAAARVPYRVGRETGSEYGETAAPLNADQQLQAYNFRMTMTADPANRVLPTAPEGYEARMFTGVLPLLKSGKITGVFGTKTTNIFKAQIPALPNGKFDINDMSHGVLRLSLPGDNLGWPDGDGGQVVRASGTQALGLPPFSRLGVAIPRQRILTEHRLWNIGLLFFLQTDPRVPEKFQLEARDWGFPKDEFEATGHFPEQLYVREARRMQGAYVYTQKDTDCAPGDARAVLRTDSIAIGDYGPNCHGTEHDGTRFSGAHTGEIYQPVAPYQIPYGVLVARDVDNLLVPGAVSSSHVGFCALRFEPIWMSLGEAAGQAAHLVKASRSSLHTVPIAQLQRQLHQTGSATVYFSDIAPGHPDFALVQWWGTLGGFHGVSPAQATPGARGKNIAGQYFEAFPGHAAALDTPLDANLADRWAKLAAPLGVAPEKLPAVDGNLTRGDWLRKAHAALN